MFEFHKEYKDNWNISTNATEEEFFDKTYDILKRLRLKSLYENFRKAMNGTRITLEFFEKNKVMTTEGHIVSDTLVSLFFKLLTEIKTKSQSQIFKFDKVIFILGDEKLSISQLLRKIDTRKYGTENYIGNPKVINKMKDKFSDFEDWMMMQSYLYGIRTKLNFNFYNEIDISSSNEFEFDFSNMKHTFF